MLDYNIEYAHIYMDESFNEEHKKAVDSVKELEKKIKKKKLSFIKGVLIDDYNPEVHKLDVQDFVKKLNRYEVKPDFVGFESKMANYKDFMLSIMSPKVRREYIKYIKKIGKVPCSLLAATWYLVRLGVFPASDEMYKDFGRKNQFVSRKIINILPKKFRETEKKALKIIEGSAYKRYLKNIEYKYI